MTPAADGGLLRVAGRSPMLDHHGDAETAAGLVDLAVNVRDGRPPDWLADVLVASVRDSGAYPDPTAARRAAAAAHRRPDGEVLLTAGAAEAFVLIARATRPRCAVVVHPQFTEPEAALRAAGHPVRRVVLRESHGFRLQPGDVPQEADLVVVGNPTNPTSVLHPAGVLAGLARPGRLLVVDEAFADTVPGEPESLASRRDLPGLVVVRSLTKTWSIAGIRAGYVLAAPEVVGALAAAQPSWPVSTPALAAILACTSPRALALAQADAVRVSADRAVLADGLQALGGIVVCGRPASSFVLVRTSDGLGVRARLRDRGFAVRRGDTFPGLGPDHLRLAVRGPGVTAALLPALAASLAPSR